MLWLGLLSWILIGLTIGALGARLLPGEPALDRWQAAAAGLGSALAGGLLASGLGFGGLAGYDIRSLAAATLCAVIGLLVLRITRLAA